MQLPRTVHYVIIQCALMGTSFSGVQSLINIILHFILNCTEDYAVPFELYNALSLSFFIQKISLTENYPKNAYHNKHNNSIRSWRGFADIPRTHTMLVFPKNGKHT